MPAPDGAKRLDVWVPLPIEDDLQKVSDLKVEATRRRDARRSRRREGRRLRQPLRPRRARRAEGRGRDPVDGDDHAHGGQRPGHGARHRPLQAGRRPRPDHGQGAANSRRRLGEKPATVRERAKKIYDHVLTTMTYDKNDAGLGQGRLRARLRRRQGQLHRLPREVHRHRARRGHPGALHDGHLPLHRRAEGRRRATTAGRTSTTGSAGSRSTSPRRRRSTSKDPAKAQWFFGHLDPDRIALTVGRDINLAPEAEGPAAPLHGVPLRRGGRQAHEAPEDQPLVRVREQVVGDRAAGTTGGSGGGARAPPAAFRGCMRPASPAYARLGCGRTQFAPTRA